MNEQEIYNKVERWLLNDQSVVIANAREVPCIRITAASPPGR